MSKTNEVFSAQCPRLFIIVALFLFSFLIFLLTTSEPKVYYGTDSGTHQFFLTKSIVEHHEVSVPEPLGVQGPDGKKYSWWGIGTTLLTVPLYYLATFLELSPYMVITVLNQIITAATVVLIYLFASALGCRWKTASGGALLYGLATFAWPSAKLAFEHPGETFFILLTFYLVFHFTRTGRGRLLLYSGITLGMAFLIRPSALLVLIGLAPLLLYERQPSGRSIPARLLDRYSSVIAGFLPAVLLYGLYNYQRFGSFFETGYTLIAQRLGVDFFFGSSPLQGIAGLLLSPGKGFFFYSPITIVALLAWKPFARQYPRLFRAFLLFSAAHLLLIANNIFWHGDWAWGPRYLLVLTPFPVLITAIGLETLSLRKWQIGTICLLIGFSVFMQIGAVSINYQRYFYYLSHEAGVPFILLEGEGVQPIKEPPMEVYFQPVRSPILLQIKFFSQALSDDCQSEFDFWWYENPACVD